MRLHQPSVAAIVPLAASLAGTCAFPAYAEIITLSNGDTLKAEITDRGDDRLTLRHPLLGTMTIPRTAVAAIAEEPAPAVVETNGADEYSGNEADDEGLLGIGLLRGWSRKLELGFSGANGKSDNAKLNVGFKGDYADTEERWAIDSAYADVGEYRNITGLDWELKMATDADLAVKLGFTNEYDSLTTGDAGKNDFQYFGGLVWGF